MEVLWEGGSWGRPPGRGDVLGCEQAEFCVGPGLRSLAHPSLRWVQEGGTADGVVCLGVTGSWGWHGADAGQRVGKSAPGVPAPGASCLSPAFACAALCGGSSEEPGELRLLWRHEGPVVAGGEMAKPAGGGLLSRRTLIPW